MTEFLDFNVFSCLFFIFFKRNIRVDDVFTFVPTTKITQRPGASWRRTPRAWTPGASRPSPRGQGPAAWWSNGPLDQRKGRKGTMWQPGETVKNTERKSFWSSLRCWCLREKKEDVLFKDLFFLVHVCREKCWSKAGGYRINRQGTRGQLAGGFQLRSCDVFHRDFREQWLLGLHWYGLEMFEHQSTSDNLKGLEMMKGFRIIWCCLDTFAISWYIMIHLEDGRLLAATCTYTADFLLSLQAPMFLRFYSLS